MSWGRVLAAWLAAAAAVATRLPSSLPRTVLAVGAGIGLAAAAVAVARRPGSRAPAAALVLCAIGLLAVPGAATGSALLALPPAVTAFAVVATLHLNLPSDDAQASRSWARGLRRRLPVLGVLLAMVALPALARRFLPERLAALHEWDTALGPLAIGAAAVLALVALASLQGLRNPSLPDAEAPALEEAT